mmetsp:Transcript_1503/g.2397  ORF Transcript_1503/g.2397 Transcript_1503/m.2397 type:complete len:109 (+) Transcript_1503:163-489(+)
MTTTMTTTMTSSQSSLARIQTLAEGAVEVDEAYRNKPRIQLLLQRYRCAYKAGVVPEVFAMRLSSILGLVHSNEDFLKNSNSSKDANLHPKLPIFFIRMKWYVRIDWG